MLYRTNFDGLFLQLNWRRTKKLNQVLPYVKKYGRNSYLTLRRTYRPLPQRMPDQAVPFEMSGDKHPPGRLARWLPGLLPGQTNADFIFHIQVLIAGKNVRPGSGPLLLPQGLYFLQNVQRAHCSGGTNSDGFYPHWYFRSNLT